MKAIKLLIPLTLLASCTISQVAYRAQEQTELEKAIKLESLGLKEYRVITNERTYYVVIPIDSVISYNTFAKYFKE